uniref:Uncharacterized protein n=1 Tax=Amphimedon queenslandica TaxID=400682 RepID=A0A1X7VLJ3_AMPQE
MAGDKSGGAKQIRTCGDAMKKYKALKDALETTHEITKLIKLSPRREAIFHEDKQSSVEPTSPGIRLLCPTRWTVRVALYKKLLFQQQKDNLVAALTVKTSLPSLHCNESFDLFWTKTMKAGALDTSGPKILRKRKVSRQNDDGNAETEYHSSPTNSSTLNGCVIPLTVLKVTLSKKAMQPIAIYKIFF